MMTVRTATSLLALSDVAYRIDSGSNTYHTYENVLSYGVNGMKNPKGGHNNVYVCLR